MMVTPLPDTGAEALRAGTTAVELSAALYRDRAGPGSQLAVYDQLGLLLASQDGGGQGFDVDGVRAGVVDPALAQDRVVHGADEPFLSAGQLVAAVAEGNLVDALAGGDDVRLQAYLAGGIVKAVGANELR
jgi:hypothetical protein